LASGLMLVVRYPIRAQGNLLQVRRLRDGKPSCSGA
jgi:hypothetical protein